MKRSILFPAIGCLIAAATAISGGISAAAAQATRGTIKGRVHLAGKPPGNTIIRMGVDPMCRKINASTRVVQETVVTSADGGLANVFVRLQGSFPQTPIGAEPVTIDQRGCIYRPRVVGARVGQPIQIKNSDSLLHNVHSLSAKANSFNVGQPTSGMVYKTQLKDEEVMLQVKCDIHRWMTLFIGVVTHPYFSVSGDGGSFEIAGVPAGTHTIQTWHEQYGTLANKVSVKPGATTTVDFTYTGAEKPAKVALQILATHP